MADTHSGWTGRRLGVYQVLEKLGAGGMGEVYRARDTKLARDIAIKILPDAFTRDQDRLTRFEREARALAALNHPHIGAIYGVEESDGIKALVLELVEGETLADRVARGPLPVAEALAVARQIADALDAAHEKGIVHRDLKPANVILKGAVGPTPPRRKTAAPSVDSPPRPIGDVDVKVLDFGLAKLTGAGGEDLSQATTATVGATSEGTILGTGAYMSPEQARGLPVDKRTDIWAFGCVLYEMLTGRRAFAGATMSDTIAAILEREPDWQALPAGTPDTVRALVRRCLEKDQRRRLRDVADAHVDIDTPSSRPPIAAAAREREGMLRSARAGWSAALALLLALATLAVVAWNRVPAVTDVAPRLSRAIRVTNSAAQEFGPAVSPDGKWVAYYANENGRTDLWVKFLDSGATSNLTATLDLELPARTGIGGIAISPDGSQIAFSARTTPEQPSYDTWVMPAPVGGVPRKLLQVLQALQWSPDGKQIVAIRPGSTTGDALVLASSDGSNMRDLVVAQPGLHIHWPAWARDSLSIYFIRTYDTWHTEPSEIYRVPVTGGSPESVVRSARRAIYPAPLPGGGLVFAANPNTIDLGLWWKSEGDGAARSLTPGVGEYTEPRLSADGRKLVATVVDVRQALVTLPLASSPPVMHAITDGYGGDLDPSHDRRGDRIVFSSTRSGQRNLWIARSDGAEPRPLTTESAIDERPAFSPDGEQIAFISDRNGQRAIWVISTAGGAPRMLVATDVLDSLTWSADGKRVIFARPEGTRTGLAAVVVADGAIAAISTPANACCPATSPTGDVIAYLQPTVVPAQGPSGSPSARLWLKFIDGQGRPLHADLPEQQFANGFLSWSPDGQRLVGASVTANGASTLWLVEPGARRPYRKLVDFPAFGRPRGLTWTRDGSSVILANQEFLGDIVMFDVSP